MSVVDSNPGVICDDPAFVLKKEGVYYSEDRRIGTRVEQFEERRFPFQTEEGVTFLKSLLWEDEVSHSMLFWIRDSRRPSVFEARSS